MVTRKLVPPVGWLLLTVQCRNSEVCPDQLTVAGLIQPYLHERGKKLYKVQVRIRSVNATQLQFRGGVELLDLLTKVEYNFPDRIGKSACLATQAILDA